MTSGGVRVGYEVFGDGEPTVLLLPTWTIVHSRFWKLQVPYLARHFRVVTFDRPGNGRSDRALDPLAHHVDAVVDQALSVLEATIDGPRGAGESVARRSRGAEAGRRARRPRVGRDLDRTVVCHRPGPSRTDRGDRTLLRAVPRRTQGWERLNAQYWRDHYQDFAEFFFSQCFPEPHSTKQREDCVGWAGETTPDMLLASVGTVLDADTIMGWANEGVGTDAGDPRRRRSRQPAGRRRDTGPRDPRRARRPRRLPVTSRSLATRYGSTCSSATSSTNCPSRAGAEAVASSTPTDAVRPTLGRCRWTSQAARRTSRRGCAASSSRRSTPQQR